MKFDQQGISFIIDPFVFSLVLTTLVVPNVTGVVRPKSTVSVKSSTEELSGGGGGQPNTDDVKWFIQKERFGKDAYNTYLCSTFYCRNLENEKEALTLPDMTPVRSQSTIELHNGTVYRSPEMERPVRLAVRPNHRMPEKNFPYFISNEILPSEESESAEGNSNSKVVEDEPPEMMMTGSWKEDKSRVIGSSFSSTEMGKTRGNYSVGDVKTLTLGGLMRRMFFPEWLRDRLSINRKGDAMDASSIMSAVTTRPILSVPSVTFDSGLSRLSPFPVFRVFTMAQFQNQPCLSPIGQNGTCYHRTECASLGGTASSVCAQGVGVCCVWRKTCGDVVDRNETYFDDNGAEFSTSVNTCTVRVNKITPFISQMKIEFQVFTLKPPTAGTCDVDRFIISGQNTNNILPILCGDNDRTHVYVETGESTNGIQLSILTTGEGTRKWSMRITQYETMDANKAPTHCLQYHTGVMGTVHSFNYNSLNSPQYLSNLNYAICIRKEAGYCSVTYSNSAPDGEYYAFQIVNANEQGNLIIPSGQAGVGIRDCPFDYLLINGYRLCGERLNDATSGVLFVEDAPVTDISSGPFTVNVRTNEIDVGGGFSFYYRQNPCMTSSAQN